MNIRNRKTPRAKWHDYNGAEYFVTICTNNREHYFGEIHDGKMQLTVVGEYTQQCVRKIEEINSDVKVPLFVIMPNHIHLIVFIDGVRENTRNIVGLSYYGSRDGNDERLPQCDSPTFFKQNRRDVFVRTHRVRPCLYKQIRGRINESLQIVENFGNTENKWQ